MVKKGSFVPKPAEKVVVQSQSCESTPVKEEKPVDAVQAEEDPQDEPVGDLGGYNDINELENFENGF